MSKKKEPLPEQWQAPVHPIARRARKHRYNPPGRGGWVELTEAFEPSVVVRIFAPTTFKPVR